MSVQASMEMDFGTYSDKLYDVIKLFNDNGWIFKNEVMEYLNDFDDDLEWQREKLVYSKLDEIISSNQKAGKTSAVRLYDVYSDGVVELAAIDTKKVSLWLDINRKRIEGERYTDASWYIQNIVGRINKQKCIVQHFVFEEIE